MSIVEKLEKMIEVLDKMTPEQLVKMLEISKLDPKQAQTYAFLERYIRESGKV